MINLYTLQEFAQITNNTLACEIISKYFEMTTDRWSTAQHGSYYLGGQVSMKPFDEITSEIIKEVNSLLYYSSVYNTTSQNEFNVILGLFNDLQCQTLRMKGLLRSIIFWLSPARKRATEKVFHPSKMMKLFEEELSEIVIEQ